MTTDAESHQGDGRVVRGPLGRAITPDHELRPTWWMDAPGEPDGTARVMLERTLSVG